MAHTPGPWTVHKDQYGWSVRTPNKWRVADIGGHNPYEVEATAHLIAAAPDLLAVCKRILNHPMIRLTGDVEVPLRAAVDKAEGKS